MRVRLWMVALLGGMSTLVVGQNPGGLPTDAKMWLKANLGTSASTTGAAVANWQDQGPLGTLLAQPNVAKQPAFHESYTNYNPAVHFDGLNDCMGVSLGSGSYTTAFTFFMVTSLLSTNSEGALFHNHSTPSGNGDLTSFQIDANGTTYRYRNSTNTMGQDGVQIAPYNASARLFTITNEDSSPNTLVKSYENGNLSNSAFFSGANRGRHFQDYYLGANRVATLNSGGTFSNNYSCEFIVFPYVLNVNERRKVETYLAVKYAFTLDNSQGGQAGDYVSTNDQLIWDASLNPAYHNRVIGIGRDDLEGLNQRQSHSISDDERIYISALVGSNANNTGTIVNDQSYVLMGANNGSNCSNALAQMEKPATISARIAREWKLTNTNLNQDFSLDLRMHFCAIPDSSQLSELRLLVDDDGDFSNAQVFSVADGITFVGGNYGVSVRNIGTQQIPMNATRYLTLGVVKPTVTFTAEQTDICAGDSVALVFQVNGGQGSVDVQLVGGSSTIELDDVQDGDTVYVQPTTTVTYSAEVRGIYACCNYGIGQDTLTIEVHAAPSLSLSTDTTVCRNAELSVVAATMEQGSQYYWSHTSNTDSTQAVTVISDTSFSVFAVDQWGCHSDTGTVLISTYPEIEASMNALDTYCPGENVEVEISAIGGHGTTYFFNWNDGVTNSSTGLESRDFSVEQTTNYTVTITDDCETDPMVLNFDILITDLPVSTFDVEPNPVLVGIPTDFIAHGGDGWEWSLNGLEVGYSSTWSYSFADPGVVEVCLLATNAIGCQHETCELVPVVPAEVLCPNVISPNKDGVNDLLEFQYLPFYPENQLQVWNRWGNLVYQKENYQNDWDGDDLVDGVYYYQLTIGAGTKGCESFFHIVMD